MADELIQKSDNHELSKEEINQKALALKDKLDLSDPDSIFQFGLEPQNELAKTSDEVIKTVKTKDSGDLNKNLTALEMLFKSDNEENNSNPFVRGWHKISNKLYEQKIKHQNLSATIENIGNNLTQSRDKLAANNDQLYKLWVNSINQANNLSPYIKAGEMTMDDMEKHELPALKQKADQGDIQAQNDYHKKLFIYHRLSRRVSDLRLAQQANVNLAAQVNAADIANNAIIERVNETVGLLVPLWKGNSAVQLMTKQSAQTAKILDKVSQFSNKQIIEASKNIHDLTVDAYKGQEKGVIDIDALKQSSNEIISAINECRDAAAASENQRKEIAGQVKEIAKQMQTALDKAGNQLSMQKPKDN